MWRFIYVPYVVNLPEEYRDLQLSAQLWDLLLIFSNYIFSPIQKWEILSGCLRWTFETLIDPWRDAEDHQRRMFLSEFLEIPWRGFASGELPPCECIARSASDGEKMTGFWYPSLLFEPLQLSDPLNARTINSPATAMQQKSEVTKIKLWQYYMHIKQTIAASGGEASFIRLYVFRLHALFCHQLRLYFFRLHALFCHQLN